MPKVWKNIFAGLVATVLAATLRAQALPKESPFAPAAGASPLLDVKSAPSSYEFVGMTAIGNVTLLSINRLADKRSVWVPLGKTVYQITAISYDPRTESAVIRVDSQTLTLPMRKAAILPVGSAPLPPVAAAMPEPAPAPTGPLPPPGTPPPPMTDAEKADEARMLVSDLLEIGLRQRKAYEEAQRQANARAARAVPQIDPTAAKH